MTILIAVEPGPSVVACRSCQIASDGRSGLRGGARLAALLRDIRQSEPRFEAIGVHDMPCLFACGASCTVLIRGPGRISYVLGRFSPDAQSARAILQYALEHARTEDGDVPYAKWPDGVKGHFLTRCPPDGYVAT